MKFTTAAASLLILAFSFSSPAAATEVTSREHVRIYADNYTEHCIEQWSSDTYQCYVDVEGPHPFGQYHLRPTGMFMHHVSQLAPVSTVCYHTIYTGLPTLPEQCYGPNRGSDYLSLISAPELKPQ